MISEQLETQSRIFCARWLPSLFHGTPVRFLGFLTNDGNKFLRFYWDQAGKDLPEEQCRDDFGLNYSFRELPNKTLVTLVTLPEPHQPGETYYMALVYRPYRRLLFVSDTTKVIALEKTDADDPAAPPTRLVEINRHDLSREIIETDPVAPGLEEFYDAVLQHLD